MSSAAKVWNDQIQEIKTFSDRQENDQDVAIKIIRKNELMHKAGKLNDDFQG